MLENHMKMLSSELGLKQAIPLEAEGVFSLHLEENLTITITDMGPGIYFFAKIGELPQESQAFIEHMMAANLFGELTDGAVLGLDPHGKQVTLSRALAEDMQYKDFHQHLETFINTVDFWRDERVEYQAPQKGAFL